MVAIFTIDSAHLKYWLLDGSGLCDLRAFGHESGTICVLFQAEFWFLFYSVVFFLLFLVFISYFYLSDGDIDVLRPTFVKWMQFLLNLRQPFLSEMRLVVTSTSLHCNNQPCTMVFMWILWATVVVRFFNWNLYVTHWIFLLFNDKKKAAA